MQIIKAALLIVGEALFQPGLQYRQSQTSQLNFLSLAVALVLGTAGLPTC